MAKRPSRTRRIKEIQVHPKPHLDEYRALHRLKFDPRAEKVYPGVNKAVMKLATDTNVDGNAMLKKGILCVGFGGGDLDDHVRSEDRPTSSAELVEEKLGLRDDPVWSSFTDYVVRADRARGIRRFELPNLVKMANRYCVNPGDAIDWVMNALEFIEGDAMQWQEALRVVREQSKEFTFRIGGGRNKPRKLLVVPYRPKIQEASRYRRRRDGKLVAGGEADVVLVVNKDGHMQIFAQPWFSFRLLRGAIRAAELTAKGKDWREFDRAYLCKLGTIPEVPEWHANSDFQLLNGSDQSHPGNMVPATKLKNSEVAKRIMDWVRLRPRRQHDEPKRITELKRKLHREDEAYAEVTANQ